MIFTAEKIKKKKKEKKQQQLFFQWIDVNRIFN